jgi:hypothetical protein
VQGRKKAGGGGGGGCGSGGGSGGPSSSFSSTITAVSVVGLILLPTVSLPFLTYYFLLAP